MSISSKWPFPQRLRKKVDVYLKCVPPLITSSCAPVKSVVLWKKDSISSSNPPAYSCIWEAEEEVRYLPLKFVSPAPVLLSRWCSGRKTVSVPEVLLLAHLYDLPLQRSSRSYSILLYRPWILLISPQGHVNTYRVHFFFLPVNWSATLYCLLAPPLSQ